MTERDMTKPMLNTFEAYFANSRKNRGQGKRPTFERVTSDDTYKDDHTQRHWWTWQQAVSAERERCATLCAFPSHEDLAHTDTGFEWDSLACASAIRRG